MFSKVLLGFLAGGLLYLGSYPTSTNFSLKAYDLGGSGGGSSSSANYKLDATTGSQGGSAAGSTNFGLQSGEPVTQNSNVPPAPTLSNPSNEYIRLKLIINTGSNPSDTKFAIAISSDNFTTTQYVKSDNSMGNSLALTDYQDYTAWGGATGFWITGLANSTTYKVKVKAMQGNFTESAYGPATAGVATVMPSITFGVATSASPTPPFNVAFTSLTAGSVFNADADVLLTLSTNAMSGGYIYVGDSNSGLVSSAAATTLNSASADLSSAPKGYGAVVTSASQVSGGPITSNSPFSGPANNVGLLSPTLQVLSNTTAAVTSASLTVQLKAKADAILPSSSDYTDTVLFVAAMTY